MNICSLLLCLKQEVHVVSQVISPVKGFRNSQSMRSLQKTQQHAVNMYAIVQWHLGYMNLDGVCRLI